ncbi:farnesyl pyrophosphate synthase-like [Dendronephthya gigantea]|uniref:farnesyl pyrophosphate synthase-like n=1 Tax=Dendronephthya gigantea TaxID=151771 RepID=UPI00106DBF66|nr:farnesyl pyrophosphate synthase-like [Dendronephthya gigantea]
MANQASRKAQIAIDRKNFNEALPKVIEQAIGQLSEETSDATEHLKKNIMYNLLGGKMNRGLTVLSTWRLLLGDKEPTDAEYYCAIVLAWCVEFLQAFFLVADDVMDQSITRRGKLCWYKQEDIGLIAVNDAVMLESCVFRLVDINFKDKKCYGNIIRLFHETTSQTEIGQTLDLITKPGENFCNFTMERYKAIVKWKTAFYSFYLPVALAMFMHDITDKGLHEAAKEILLEMGEFFQIQDDYLDCYGDPEVTGKVGTDIEETKCSWLLVQALQRVDQEQMNVLKVNYGVNDPVAVAKVKEIYSKLNIKKVYQDYEEISFVKLMALIDKAPSEMPKEIFTELAGKIYKRDK